MKPITTSDERRIAALEASVRLGSPFKHPAFTPEGQTERAEAANRRLEDGLARHGVETIEELAACDDPESADAAVQLARVFVSVIQRLGREAVKRMAAPPSNPWD